MTGEIFGAISHTINVYKLRLYGRVSVTWEELILLRNGRILDHS